jgi:predicted RNase H-like HicB family nuclease
MNGYAVIIEGDGESFSGYAPDLPGCVAVISKSRDTPTHRS